MFTHTAFSFTSKTTIAGGPNPFDVVLSLSDQAQRHKHIECVVNSPPYALLCLLQLAIAVGEKAFVQHGDHGFLSCRSNRGKGLADLIAQVFEPSHRSYVGGNGGSRSSSSISSRRKSIPCETHTSLGESNCLSFILPIRRADRPRSYDFGGNGPRAKAWWMHGRACRFLLGSGRGRRRFSFILLVSNLLFVRLLRIECQLIWQCFASHRRQSWWLEEKGRRRRDVIWYYGKPVSIRW
mmetsp:Transcript_29822/g.41504  ORF Transcript_29822/g.41504 Transcript_29822/m.41504 type:complete len:238 (+) Transcript_29822:202-915(+)